MHEQCMFSAGSSSDYIKTCRQEEQRRWEVEEEGGEVVGWEEEGVGRDEEEGGR